jgi:hypothetical protein
MITLIALSPGDTMRGAAWAAVLVLLALFIGWGVHRLFPHAA